MAKQVKLFTYDPALTPADEKVLSSLERDVKAVLRRKGGALGKNGDKKQVKGKDEAVAEGDREALDNQDTEDITSLKAQRNPESSDFQPTIFVSADGFPTSLPAFVNNWILGPYVYLAKKVVRHETDVVMLTHLLIYFTTSVPSAVFLYRHFSYLHGVFHLIMQGYYIGTYTLMMHQHIHQRGILSKPFVLIDTIFPYITDPLMGHTWNSYYYHHVKHHHVEGNGPKDLSSTIRYQRDSVWDFLKYVGRFYFFVWLDLPLYFVSKNRPSMAVRTAFWELGTYLFYYFMIVFVHPQATLFVFLIPLMLVRFGLMVGNWGQHAFVDDVEPDSDYRSSITLIDVASNRFCFNDGYHTSHHLNPLRHWRDHPISLLEQKQTYAKEGALIFHNIDFIMITVRLLMKDYEHLAKCLVPIGSQITMSLEEKKELLARLTRKFTEADVESRYASKK